MPLFVKPIIEQLETRLVPDATSVMATLQDANIRTLAQKDFARDGMLNRSDMIGIFREVVKEGKKINATELGDLGTLINNSTALKIPDYVENLASKVIDFNPANKHFHSKVLVSNGQLSAGDGAGVLTDLIDKWFLGQDLPAAVDASGGRHSYAWAQGSLFGSHGPSNTAVMQGDIGDCFFMAALGETAARDPQAIRSMFISNGDGTYTVRFYEELFGPDGLVQIPQYVTVNTELPESSGRFIFANAPESISSKSNVLWAALAEKAYAQIAEEGWSAAGAANSYRSINGGSTAVALQQVVGEPASWNAPLTSKSLTQLIADVKAGDLVTLDTEPSEPKGSPVVADHSYYVVGYSSHSGTFTALNPWGTHFGSLHLTASQIERYFLDFDEAAA